jgi:hypothetical protein
MVRSVTLSRHGQRFWSSGPTRVIWPHGYARLARLVKHSGRECRTTEIVDALSPVGAGRIAYPNVATWMCECSVAVTPIACTR